MSTDLTGAAAPIEHPTRESGSTPPLATAAFAALGPLLMCAFLFTTPWGVSNDVPASVALILANPTRTEVAVVLVGLAAVFGSAGSLVVTAVLRRSAPRFAGVAGALAFSGWVVAGYPGPLVAVVAAGALGLGPDQTLALVAGIDSSLPGRILGALFVLVPAGNLLLGVAALMASRTAAVDRYPRWAAVVLAAAMPLVLACGMLNQQLLAAAWLVLALGYAAAGWQYRRSGS